MEEYSYISENGTVRQIRDLIAKAKDAEQDAKILALEQKVGSPWETLWSGRKTTSGDVTLSNSIRNYTEISVVFSLLSSQETDARIHVMNIPNAFYVSAAQKARTYGVSTTAYNETAYINFRLGEPNDTSLRISSIGYIQNYEAVLLGVYGRK